MAYQLGELGGFSVSVPAEETLPVVIDDMSLSYHLGINNWAMWHFLRQAGTPVGDQNSCYSLLAISKRGRAGKRGKVRKTYVSSPRIKDVQNSITSRFLLHMPVGDWVCAYESGKSTIDTAQRCSNKAVVVQLDLKDFFPTIRRSWIRNLFQKYGYSRYIANLLAGLLCATEQYKDANGNTKLRHFLPQGSAAAPFVSNRVADQRFDQEVLAILADTGWEYMRYSDNIYIVNESVVTRAGVQDMLKQVRSIIHKAGWRTHKVRVDLKWKRQKVLGLVVNEKANLPKEEYYALKALLHNCAKNGFEAELERAKSLTKKDIPNVTRFIAHLRGRLSYACQVLCESRVIKLRGFMDAALADYKSKLESESKMIVDENLLTEPILDILQELSNTAKTEQKTPEPSSEAS